MLLWGSAGNSRFYSNNNSSLLSNYYQKVYCWWSGESTRKRVQKKHKIPKGRHQQWFLVLSLRHIINWNWDMFCGKVILNTDCFTWDKTTECPPVLSNPCIKLLYNFFCIERYFSIIGIFSNHTEKIPFKVKHFLKIRKCIVFCSLLIKRISC